MPRIKTVEALLRAFARVFTQPLEQDLKDSLATAAVSVMLATMTAGTMLLANGQCRTPGKIGGSSLVLILLWMALTAILTNVERRKLTMARHLSIVSFWIAVTLVLVLAAELVRPDQLAQATRGLIVAVLLVVLVPVHVFRSLPFGSAVWMTLALWLTTGVFANTVLC